MGVNRLTALLTRYAPDALRQVHANHFAYQTIAIDASCHLNKFMYGDEPHPFRHIYGFYLLARFCDMNKINPIFVFDGPSRIAAKRLEQTRREKGRLKVNYSLVFERERMARLDSWHEIVEPNFGKLSEETAVNILSLLGETLDELEEEQVRSEPLVTAEAAAPEDVVEIDQEVAERHTQLEDCLVHLANDVNRAILEANDADKYTRTVRDLSAQERDVMVRLIRTRLSNVNIALHDLQQKNRQALLSLEKRSIRITQKMRDECRHFLKTLGYPCFTSFHHEAEAMCAKMAVEHRTTATISEDLDTIVFGDAPLLRYFFAKGRPILVVDPVKARQQLQLDRDAFIDMCILCGTDFSGTIQGIGPVRALHYMQQYGSIEKLLQHLPPKYVPEEDFDFQLARQTFKELPPIPPDSTAYTPGVLDPAAAQHLLSIYEIDPQEVEDRLNTIRLQQLSQNYGAWGPNPFNDMAPF